MPEHRPRPTTSPHAFPEEPYFAAGKHKKGAEKLDSIVKPEQVKDVQTFLVNHASDSPQPETCGG